MTSYFMLARIGGQVQKGRVFAEFCVMSFEL
jgi:hypothetical protein